MTFAGRHLTKADKLRFEHLQQLGCVVCWLKFGLRSPAEIHHIRGKVRPDAHQLTIPLCFRHHREGSDNDTWTSRHPWRAKFVERYGSEDELLEITNIMLAKMLEKMG